MNCGWKNKEKYIFIISKPLFNIVSRNMYLSGDYHETVGFCLFVCLQVFTRMCICVCTVFLYVCQSVC